MGMKFGIWTMGYIAVQVWWIGLVVWLQHAAFLCGVLALRLGIWIRRKTKA